MPKNPIKSVMPIFLLALIFSASCGCLQSPENGTPTYSSIPKLIIDYDFDSALFKLYLRSAVSDYKFNQLKILVNNSGVSENDTYMLSYSCAKSVFELQAEAVVEVETFYELSLTVTIVNDIGNNIFLNIIDKTPRIEKEYQVAEDDLPWKKILVQKD